MGTGITQRPHPHRTGLSRTQGCPAGGETTYRRGDAEPVATRRRHSYTDGSATAGTKNDGAGVIWKRGREETRIKTAAGRFTSSYFADLHAHNEAAKYLEVINYLLRGGSDQLRRNMYVRIQSALRRLAEGPA